MKLPDGMLVLCTLVDTSGYSTAVQQKYQAYFITEVPLEINGQTLKPGAYGVGFIEGTKFIVMDVGAHDLFTAAGNRDAALKRPDAPAGSRRYHARPLHRTSTGITWCLSRLWSVNVMGKLRNGFASSASSAAWNDILYPAQERYLH